MNECPQSFASGFAKVAFDVVSGQRRGVSSRHVGNMFADAHVSNAATAIRYNNTTDPVGERWERCANVLSRH